MRKYIKKTTYSYVVEKGYLRIIDTEGHQVSRMKLMEDATSEDYQRLENLAEVLVNQLNLGLDIQSALNKAININSKSENNFVKPINHYGNFIHFVKLDEYHYNIIKILPKNIMLSEFVFEESDNEDEDLYKLMKKEEKRCLRIWKRTYPSLTIKDLYNRAFAIWQTEKFEHPEFLMSKKEINK